MSKVHIVGAGPSGSIAAISALRSNHEVIMSEDHPVAGIPENCSGLFSKDGLDSLRTIFDYRRFILNPIYGADIYLGGEKLEIRRKTPVSFVCDRALMDYHLAEKAENEGAKINYAQKIKDKFESNNIIGADGPLSTVARHFNFPKIKNFASTLQIKIPYKCDDPHAVEVHLSDKFPGFFAWIIPQNEEQAEIGLGVELPNVSHVAWRHFLKYKGITYSQTPKGAPIPISLREKTALVHNGFKVILVGDAAGQVKSTTGGGVIFGGNCAILAGKYFNDPYKYEQEWHSKFGFDLKLHRFVHNYLMNKTDTQLMGLGKWLKKINFDKFLSENGHMDKPTKMLNGNLLFHALKNVFGAF